VIMHLHCCVAYLKLCGKGSIFQWNDECEQAFIRLKDVLTSPGRQHNNADALSRRPCKVCFGLYLQEGRYYTKSFLLVELKFFARHHDSVNRYGISVSQMTTDMFHLNNTIIAKLLLITKFSFSVL
jgi:hypothetical protein